MNRYFLIGAFSFSVTDSADPGQKYCAVIGKRAFHCSESVLQVLSAIDRESEIDGITASVNCTRTGHGLTEEEVRQLIETRLIPAGVVSTSLQSKTPQKKSSYLFVDRTIIGASAVNQISRLFVAFFNRNIACLATTVSCALVGLWFWNLNVSGLSPWSRGAGYGFSLSESILMYALMLASFMFHEFGHASASRHYGAKPAEIGFGLYLIFPVFYCNVTEIWRLPRLQRIVVSLGGVYFQLIASAILVPFALAADSRVLNVVIAGNLLAMLVTMNPFFRFDGYWIYSDFFSIPNLRNRAEEVNAAVLRSLFAGKANPEKAPNALRWYAAGSAIFFSGFTVLTTGTTWKAFAAVPEQVHGAIKVFGDEPGWEMALNIVAASSSYVFFLVGCLLTFCYAIATVIRSLRMLIQTLSMQGVAEPRSTPHA